MSDRHALLTAIRSNPDEDLPRLVYADWLEEHGEPERAELVRLTVVSYPAGYSLSRREAELVHDLTDSLGMPVAALKGLAIRGIVELVECTWELWRDHGDLIWERELPWKVRLTTEPTMHEGGDIEYVGGTGPYRTGRYRVSGAIVSASLWRQGDFNFHRAAILSARWPGIEFELPVGVPA